MLHLRYMSGEELLSAPRRMAPESARRAVPHVTEGVAFTCRRSKSGRDGSRAVRTDECGSRATLPESGRDLLGGSTRFPPAGRRTWDRPPRERAGSVPGETLLPASEPFPVPPPGVRACRYREEWMSRR